MCAFDEYSCVCAQAHADAFIKNSALSAHCFHHVCSLINIPAAGQSGAGSEAHSHKRTRRRKGRIVAGLVLSWAFVRGSTPSPSAGQRREMEGYSAEGVVLRNTPRPGTVTSSSLCLRLSKGPEGSTPELKHHCLLLE